MLERTGWMNFRTSYLNHIFKLFVCAFLTFITPISIAEPLKITGPDGQSRQLNRQYGPTTKADTFWSIAQKMRPNTRVSIYQVMAAIYDANPHAFASSNYNSLEVGMILLVPPADKMLAIPISIAKERAKQDDKSWKKRAQPVNASEPKIEINSKPVEEQSTEVKTETENPQKINQLTLLLEEEESKVISLTDELSRTQDELTMAKDDLETLKNRITALSDKVDLLEGSLTETRQLNASLKAENKLLQDSLALEKEEKPTDIWRELLDSPLAIVLITVVPGLLILVLLFLVWRRKQSASEQNLVDEKQPEPAPEPIEEIQPQDIELDPVVQEDNAEVFFEEVAVQLDDVESDDSVENNAMTEEASASEEDTPITETDMDDLWAEALDEQNDGKEISSDVEELLSKLDEPEQTITEAYSEEKPEDSDVEPEFGRSQNNMDEIDFDELIESTEVDLDNPIFDESQEAEPNTSDVSSNNTDVDDLIASTDMDLQNPISEVPQDSEFGNDENDTNEMNFDEVVASSDINVQDPFIDESQRSEVDDSENNADEENVDEINTPTDMDLQNSISDVPQDVEFGNDDNDTGDITFDELVESSEVNSQDPFMDKSQPSEIDDSKNNTDEVTVGELSETPEIDIQDPFLEESQASDMEDAKNEADEERFDEPLDTTNIEHEQVDSVGRTELGVSSESLFDESMEESNSEQNSTSISDENVEDDNETSDSTEIRNNHVDDFESEPLSSEIEENSRTEPELVTETQASETDLPVPEFDEVSEEINSEVGLDTALPEPDEAVDDLDTLMAEFNVETPSHVQDSNLPSPDADNSLDSLDASSLDKFEEPEMLEPELELEPSSFEDDLAEFTDDEAQEPEEKTELGFEDESSSQERLNKAEDTSSPLSELSIDDIGLDSESSRGLSEDTTPEPTNESMPDLDFEMDLSDDELFDSFTQVSDEIKHTEALISSDLNELDTDENSDASSFEGDNMTVDEALAALDDEIDSDIDAEKISDDDLSSFQKENGYIDIDKLLNESSEESTDLDPYKEVDVNLGESSELESLFESNPMVDVDDAENSVNAKLDLARAYIEIDDKDSAKALLEEIQIDGNERQKSEAIELLSSIG